MGSASPRDMLNTPWIETPLIESSALSKAAGCRIFLKYDNLQPSGSFKSRGVGNVILQSILSHPPNTKLHFYSSSGGNAGLAAVTAAKALGYPGTVVVPMTTDEMMIARITAAGASEVIRHGASWQYADEFLRNTIIPERSTAADDVDGGETGIYVPPFDHPHVWEGNSTIISELTHQMPSHDDTDNTRSSAPDAVVCSVGGGGLFSGLHIGLSNHRPWSEYTRLLAVETEGAASLHASLQADHRVTLPKITSIAKSLGAVRVSDHAFRSAHHDPNVTSLVLSDAEACMGCWRLADDERILVEPACGVSVALAYNGLLKTLLPNLNHHSKIVIVVCGGSDITLERLVEYRGKYADQVKEISAERQRTTGTGGVSVKGQKPEEEVGAVPSSFTAPELGL